MKNLILIIAFILIGCEYQDITYVTINGNNPETETNKFPAWLQGTFDPYHLPEAANMVATADTITIDLTGFDYNYTLTFDNSTVEIQDTFVKVTYQDKVFTFWKSTNADIEVTLFYGELFELGYFIKQ